MLRRIPELALRAFQKPLPFFGTFFIVFTVSYGVLFHFDWLPELTGSWAANQLILLGVLTGILQLIGYLIYLSDENIEPEPVTWFMFAYGTAILAVLEWDANATLPELILPTVCGILAIVVSFKCWQKARELDPTRWWPRDWWPEDIWDRSSFISDILITIGYVIAWAFATFAILTSTQYEWAVFAFLFLSNLSTFPQFYPILHSTYVHPEKENWVPWAIWALAYAILGWVAWVTHGAFWHPLMFYPVSNAVLHAAVGVLAARTHRRHEREAVLYG